MKPVTTCADQARSRKLRRIAQLLSVSIGTATCLAAVADPIDHNTIYQFGIRPGRDDHITDQQSIWGAGGKTSLSVLYGASHGASLASGTQADASITCPVVGNPIVLANANKTETELDFASRTHEMPLSFSRTYNGNSGRDVTILGGRWLTNLDYRLDVRQFDAVIHRPDGTRISVIKNPDGTFRPPAGQPQDDYLVGTTGGVYTLHTLGHTVEKYQSIGDQRYRIIEVKNRQGVGWTFHYHPWDNATGVQGQFQPYEVVHTSGQKISLAYDGTKLRSVTDPAGNVYKYAFSTAGGFGIGALSSVTTPDGQVTTYHYDGDHHELHGKSFNGTQYSTFGWQQVATPTGTRRVPVSTEHAGGVNKVQVAYTFATNGSVAQAVETNALGRETVYAFSNGKLTRVDGRPSTHCGASAQSITYDSHGNQDVVTHPERGKVDYDYDDNGRLSKMVEGPGTAGERTTEYVWNASKGRLDEVNVAGHYRTVYAYTDDDRIASVTKIDASGAQRVTRYSYTEHANGLLKSVTEDGPLAGSSDAITRTYDANGALVSVTDGRGHATTYANHNGLGLPGRVVTPAGATTDYQYDGSGRVILMREWRNGQAADTHYVYAANGLLDAIQHPNGLLDLYIYDAARRLIEHYESNTEGGYSVRRTTYNALSQPTTTRIEGVRGGSGPATLPAAPTLSAPASNTNGSYTVQWGQVSGALSYQLEEAKAGGAWSVVYSGSELSSALTGRSTDASHAYRARACNYVGCGGYSNTVTVSPIAYDAQFVGQSVPAAMVVGQSYSVSVQLRNTGNTTWTKADYRLGSQNPHDNTRWGTHRIAPTADVAPGAVGTFTFNVTAPADGAHAFQWRMVRDGHAWFGVTTPNVNVNTYSGSISASPNPCAIPEGGSVCASAITWGTTSGGAEVWVSNLDGSAAQLFDGTNTGTASAPWIPATGKRFELRKYGLPVAHVDVKGQLVGRATQYVTQAVPRVMLPGQTLPVSVTFQNTGRFTWTDATNFRLGSQSPQGNTTWGMSRVNLPGPITSYQNADFHFNITAPTTPGTYAFQWQMVQDAVAWFGPRSPQVDVVVAGGGISASANPCRIFHAGGMCSSTISWNSSHGGAEVWVTNLDGSFPQLFMPNTKSGSASAPWITVEGKRFHLKYGGATLATVDVRGYLHPLPPEPEEPTHPVCNPVTNICEQPR